jgi:hypothetical protein
MVTIMTLSKAQLNSTILREMTSLIFFLLNTHKLLRSMGWNIDRPKKKQAIAQEKIVYTAPKVGIRIHVLLVTLLSS